VAAAPPQDRAELDRRQAAVAALADAPLARDALRESLGETYDLERPSRTAGGRADATDLLRIRRTLALLPEVADALTTDPTSPNRPLLTCWRAWTARRSRACGGTGGRARRRPAENARQGGLLRGATTTPLDELLAEHRG